MIGRFRASPGRYSARTTAQTPSGRLCTMLSWAWGCRENSRHRNPGAFHPGRPRGGACHRLVVAIGALIFLRIAEAAIRELRGSTRARVQNRGTRPLQPGTRAVRLRRLPRPAGALEDRFELRTSLGARYGESSTATQTIHRIPRRRRCPHAAAHRRPLVLLPAWGPVGNPSSRPTADRRRQGCNR